MGASAAPRSSPARASRSPRDARRPSPLHGLHARGAACTATCTSLGVEIVTHHVVNADRARQGHRRAHLRRRHRGQLEADAVVLVHACVPRDDALYRELEAEPRGLAGRGHRGALPDRRLRRPRG